MKLSIFYWMRASASAVFLFGFDMIVISAAEKTIQSLWGQWGGLDFRVTPTRLYRATASFISSN